jgi:hypothetical protein
MAIKISDLKAARADDAPIDFEIWTWPNETKSQTRARDLLRYACHSFWRLNLMREATHWLRTSPNAIPAEIKINKAAIVDCLTRANNSTYWDWADGSRLFFWRWEHWWKSARDGEVFFHEEPTRKWMGYSLPADTWHYELLLRKKEEKLIQRRYLEDGYVDCIVPRFGVPKGEDDIRLVWDASRNGVNETLWAPSFWMPTFRTLQDLIIKWLPCSVSDYFEGKIPDHPRESDWRIPHQADMDVGEMFLNYTLHYSERHAFGVRIASGDEHKVTYTTKRFSRLMFGGTPCPYVAVQGHARCLELVVGNRLDPTNPLGWIRVIENYPLTRGYDPSMPRVIRVRADGDMAPGIPAFVDDGRVTGPSDPICDAATHQLCTQVNAKGEQNASRKRRNMSKTPGAWTGKLLWTDEPHPRKAILPEKWKIHRQALIDLHQMIDEDSPVDRSFFLSLTCRGMSQTEVYTDLRPYYKSFYNALEEWRPDRDEEGWKRDDDSSFDEEADSAYQTAPPPTIRVTKELRRDLDALLLFYENEDPVFLLVRPRSRDDVVYIAGDASAAAYGAAVQNPDGSVTVRLGNWTAEETARGSNWREATNLVRCFLADVSRGLFDGKEVWTITDNLVFSLVSNKGMSKSKGLSDLVLQTKYECRRHEVFWHPLHCSGRRMIKIGMDGTSRGDFDSGMMLGQDIRDLVPLGASALDFEGNGIHQWAKAWMGADYSNPLTPEGWFSIGHQPGVHFWAPPPAAALIALEELAQSKLKRPFEVTHVFVCPRLLYFEEWRRRFAKEMDFWFLIEPNSSLWPNSCCEPLVFGISFPLRSAKPWKLRRVPNVVALGREMQEVFKSGSELGERDILCKLWSDPWGFFGL